MALFQITIEKLIIQCDDEKLDLILKKLDELSEDPKGELKQEIFDKLTAIKKDIEETV